MNNLDTYGYNTGALMDALRRAQMDPVGLHYGSSEGELMYLLVLRGHVWITWTLVDNARGPLMDPGRWRKLIQYGGTYGSSEGGTYGSTCSTSTLMDNRVWILCRDAYGSNTKARMNPLRGRIWIH